MKPTLIFALFISTLNSYFTVAQTFDGKFSGCWASTNFDFSFKKDGTYQQVYDGHMGFNTIKGNYRKVNDTIILFSRGEKTDETVTEKYIIDNDSILIDNELGYGYLLATKKYKDPVFSYCYINYPEIQAVNRKTEAMVEEALNMAFNSPEMKQFYHFDKFTDRKLLVANYYKLTANIVADGHEAIFMPKKSIKEKFYIEFEEFSQDVPYELIFKVLIHGEGAHIWFIFDYENGKLVMKKPSVTEK